MSKNRNRVSPLPSKKGSLVDAEKGAWAGKQKNEKEGTVRRRRRSFEAGTEEYADYVQKRVFNKRESWRPFLWERRRDKNLLGNLNPTRGWKGWKYRQRMRWNSWKYTWREWSTDLELWRDSLKKIEDMHGV